MRMKDIKLIIDNELDRNKDINNHLLFISFDSATVSLTVIQYLIGYRIVFLLCKDINCGIIASDMITRIIILFGCY